MQENSRLTTNIEVYTIAMRLVSLTSMFKQQLSIVSFTGVVSFGLKLQFAPTFLSMK